jgi:hypothetical protein
VLPRKLANRTNHTLDPGTWSPTTFLAKIDHDFKSSRRHQRRPVQNSTFAFQPHPHNGKVTFRWMKTESPSKRGYWLTHDAIVDIKSQDRPALVQEQGGFGKATGRVEDRAGPTSHTKDCRRIGIEAYQDVSIASVKGDPARLDNLRAARSPEYG